MLKTRKSFPSSANAVACNDIHYYYYYYWAKWIIISKLFDRLVDTYFPQKAIFSYFPQKGVLLWRVCAFLCICVCLCILLCVCLCISVHDCVCLCLSVHFCA
jgi:hypothetical protein